MGQIPMIPSRLIAGTAFVTAAITLPAKDAAAHGFAGQRFFPATILTDDPFVADEISLPTITRPPTGADGAQEIGIDVDLAKRITPDFGFTIGQGWKYLQPQGSPVAARLTRPANAPAYPTFST